MPAAEENTTPESVSKKNRVQLKHVLLDVTFFEKPNIRALDFRFGPMASALLVRLYAAMSAASDAEIETDCYLAICAAIGFKEAEALLAYCVERGILSIGSSPNLITNSRVCEDQERCAEERESAIERKRKFDEKKKEEQERVQNAFVTRSPVTGSVTVTGSEDPKKEERRIVSPVEIDPVAAEIARKPERAPLVYLSDQEVECAVGEYMRFKLDPARAWVEEGIKRLSGWYQKNPDKFRAGKFAYVDLTGWAKDKCQELKTQGLKLVSAQAYANKATGKNGNAPPVAKTSPPRGFELAKEN